MPFRRIVITGGAGFVGSSLALSWKRSAVGEVVAVDSLKRRGSEVNLSRLQEAKIPFVHADVRCPEDLEGLPEYDLLIDCSAEPSVHAGVTGTSSRYLLNTNLLGTINCLEAACARQAAFLFLSTSRVYPIAALNAIPHFEEPTRFSWDLSNAPPGVSQRGITEAFPLSGARSFYGTSKLASELLVQEYVHARGLRALINRCGLLSGAWQFGKVDQGVVALWVARHHFGQPLRYLGYGGTGKQVRDVLHVEDLFDLIVKQCDCLDLWDGRVYNVGGGLEMSVSLLELTGLCRNVTRQEVPIGSLVETSSVDIRMYVTDSSLVEDRFDWKPRRTVEQVVRDIHKWLCDRPADAKRIFLG